MAEIVNNLPATLADRRSPSKETLAQTITLNRLSRLKRGRLSLVLPGGKTLVFGAGTPEAEIRVHDQAFFRRLLAAADVGAGESYMAGEWSTPDLVTLTRLFLGNEELFEPHPILGTLKRLGDRLVHAVRANTLRRAPKNIAAHYDLSNELYALFLDSSMTYSSACFRSPDDTLLQAQENKYRVLAERAGVRRGHHVLEIGCGWGGFAEFAAREFGCRVTSLTLSEAQAEYGRRRIQRAGLDHLAEIRVQDYRSVSGTFDAVVSIEMLEAVGHRYLGDFFAACHRLLTGEGRAALQVITIPDQLYDGYRRGTDFIRRHIFPGGHLPSLQAIQNAIARHSAFVIQDVENIAAHYAETLRRWRTAFMNRLDRVDDLGFDHRFCRMWEFYLATCEAGFAHGKLGTLQITLARPGRVAADELFSPDHTRAR